MTHHLHALHLVPVSAALLWWWLARDPARRLRQAAVLAVFAALPLLLKAGVVPVMAGANKTLCWGVPDTAGRLTAYLAARQYKGGMFRAAGPGEAVQRFLVHTGVLPVEEFGPVLALAAPGAALLYGLSPPLAWGVAATIAVNVALTVPYTASGINLFEWELLSSRRYLTTYALLAVLIGLGAARVFRTSRVVLAAGLACLLLEPAAHRATAMRARHTLAYDFAINQLACVGPNGILICEGDEQAFPLIYLTDVLHMRPDVTVIGMPDACWEVSARRLAMRHPGLVFPPFVADPGRQLPRLILANAPAHPAYYTPGCTGNGSERVLVPVGLVYEAHIDPADAAAVRSRFARFPALRLRGTADARAWGDPMTVEGVKPYGLAMAYHGAAALESGRFDEAVRFLRAALRIPMQDEVRAVALTHLGLAYATTGHVDAAEPLYRQALRLRPDLGPAMFELARVLAVMRRDPGEIRALLINAARHPEYLSRREREELGRYVGGPTR